MVNGSDIVQQITCTPYGMSGRKVINILYSVHQKSGDIVTETVYFYIVITYIRIEQNTDVNDFYID